MKRVLQLDYLKGVFILLMIIFHLSVIDQKYPMMRAAVYTFHMSGFLIISGYLANIEKDLLSFLRGMMKLLIPYVIFESFYIIMLYVAGVHWGGVIRTTNTIENLSIISLLDRVAQNPIGPYWYIHTLLLCSIIYYLIYRVLKLRDMTAFLLMASVLYCFSFVLDRFTWSNIIYFLIGVFFRRSGLGFLEIIKPSIFAILPLCILFSSSQYFNRGSLAGVAITLLVISLLLYIYNYTPEKLRYFFNYLGKNSLVIVLFSPLFTVATKLVAPYFVFDESGLSFVLVSVSFVMVSCLFSSWLCDKLHISRYLFCEETIYKAY